MNRKLSTITYEDRAERDRILQTVFQACVEDGEKGIVLSSWHALAEQLHWNDGSEVDQKRIGSIFQKRSIKGSGNNPHTIRQGNFAEAIRDVAIWKGELFQSVVRAAGSRLEVEGIAQIALCRPGQENDGSWILAGSSQIQGGSNLRFRIERKGLTTSGSVEGLSA